MARKKMTDEEKKIYLEKKRREREIWAAYEEVRDEFVEEFEKSLEDPDVVAYADMMEEIDKGLTYEQQIDFLNERLATRTYDEEKSIIEKYKKIAGLI